MNVNVNVDLAESEHPSMRMCVHIACACEVVNFSGNLTGNGNEGDIEKRLKSYTGAL